MKKRRHTFAASNRGPSNPKHEQSARVLEVEIERIVPGGAGMAHADGLTIFVGLAAPGDRLLVEINQTRGRVAFASIKEIIKPSAQRTEPACPYFGRCGGCDFQQLDYEAQLAAKVSILRDCLRRIARIEPPVEIPIVPSPAVWHYRSRAKWQYDRSGERLGYFERGTHRVCDVAECPVIVPELQKVLSELRLRVPASQLPADAAEFEAVAGDDGAFSLHPPVWEERSSEAVCTIGGERYHFRADSFFQINRALLEALIGEATRDATGEWALDLYCGVGLFTLPLARRFKHVIGVEANETAINYARRNLEAAELSNASFESAKVSSWLNTHASDGMPVDLILLDPPRAGAEEGVVQHILAINPRRISYVSCDPATLARDLKPLIEGGYLLEAIRAFDMFPQTHHVEAVAHLSYRRRSAAS